MWELVQSRGDVSTLRMPSIEIQTKIIFLSLLPWWLDSRAKWYERTPTCICGRNWQDPESCEALLEWLGLANPEWLGSSLIHMHPRSSIMYPKYWTRVMPKVHFSKLVHSLCCHNVWRTCQMWWRCSSQLWLKINMPSKYTTTNELVNDSKMSFISLMKVAGTFVNSKGITNHSKRPSLALKAIFHTSEGLIGT